MSLSRKLKLTGHIALFLLIVFLLSNPSTSSASTVISGDITTNTTWTQANSPYIVESAITVNPGKTLTIEPGVVVKFNNTDSGITIVAGTLNANGTAENKIYFTSYKDDTIGGDTNGDGGDTVPLAGDWSSIYFANTNAVGQNLSNIVIKYGGYNQVPAIRVGNYTGVIPFNITNSNITHNAGPGIRISVANAVLFNIDSTEISFNDYSGLLVDAGQITITNSSLQNNAPYGAVVGTIGSSISATNNFWGDATGPYHSTNPTGLGNEVSGSVSFVPWLESDPLKNFTRIPSHFGPNGTTVYCDTVSLNFGFGYYKLGIAPGDGSYFKSITRGSDLCTGSFDAPGNITNPGKNFLTMYLSQDDTIPYGYIEFFCTSPVTNPGDCVIVNDTAPPVACTENCNSSVMFLPGMMGSKLYRQTGFEDCVPVAPLNNCFQDEELWSYTSDSKQELLRSDATGKSVYSIYTKDDTKYDGIESETGIVDEIGSLNIYKSFLADLQKWKEDEKIIEDYAFIPYDWRLSLEDIITNGKVVDDKLSYTEPQEFSESFILKTLQDLQATSRTGKVTIVTHSNGGLVAKALIQKLKDTNNPVYEKIDKVILVAMPQLGTPEALVSLLHGRDVGFGLIMKNERQRWLAENMPVAYNLLPSEKYFDTLVNKIPFAPERIISFKDTEVLDSFIEEYGFDISSYAELESYIFGADGRTKPDYKDTHLPSIGNSFLYQQAKDTHNIIDNWQPYTDTKVIQVAGWGEETIAGIDYSMKHNKIAMNPRWVVDGDATVVTPSALWMSPDDNPNVERWWVDLLTYNDLPGASRDHKNILEIKNLRNFIKSKVTSSFFTDPENIILDNDSSLTSTDARLHYILHSPLALGITDSEGRYTGLDPITGEIKTEIPNVVYKSFGDTQFISTPTGVSYTLKLQGIEDGAFSLDIEKQLGNDVIETTTFENISSLSTTLATLKIDSDFQLSLAKLEIDQNADGEVDEVYPKVEEEETPPMVEEEEVETPVNNPPSNSSSGGVGFPAPVESKQEQILIALNTENIEQDSGVVQGAETVEKDEVTKETKMVEEKEIEQEVVSKEEQTENTEEKLNIESEEELTLTGAVIDAEVKNNWIWYVIILGLMLLGLIFKRFVKF